MRTAERPAIYIKQLLERYAVEIIPTKAAATQRDDNQALVNLRKVFGDMRLEDLEPQHIYRYVDTRMNNQGQKSTATGVREARVSKHAFTKAVEWGLMSRHPFKGEVRLKGMKPRNRYIEDWEIIEALALVPKRKCGSVLMLQAYIRVKNAHRHSAWQHASAAHERHHRYWHHGATPQDRELYWTRSHV